MTPTQIEEFARQQYNAVNDTFFTQDEILNWIYKAQMDFCKYTFMLRDVFTTTSVADQKEYSFPENTVSVKRLEYNDQKVTPIDFREADDVSNFNVAITITDTPTYYYQWGNSFFLVPTPSESSVEIKAWVYKRPQLVTNTSTIEIPEEYHINLVDYVNWRMALKDENPAMAAEFRGQWENAMIEARKLERRKLRGDSFTSVKDIDRLAVTRYGNT